jgi:hypothetical protein
MVGQRARDGFVQHYTPLCIPIEGLTFQLVEGGPERLGMCHRCQPVGRPPWASREQELRLKAATRPSASSLSSLTNSAPDAPLGRHTCNTIARDVESSRRLHDQVSGAGLVEVLGLVAN